MPLESVQRCSLGSTRATARGSRHQWHAEGRRPHRALSPTSRSSTHRPCTRPNVCGGSSASSSVLMARHAPRGDDAGRRRRLPRQVTPRPCVIGAVMRHVGQGRLWTGGETRGGRETRRLRCDARPRRGAPALLGLGVSAVTGVVRRCSCRACVTTSSAFSSRVGSRSPSTRPTAAKSCSPSSAGRPARRVGGDRARARQSQRIQCRPRTSRVPRVFADDLRRFLVAHPAAAARVAARDHSQVPPADRRRVDATALDASHRLAHFLVERADAQRET